MTTFLTTTGIKRILIEQNAQFYLKAENGTATAVIEKGGNKLSVSKCISEFMEMKQEACKGNDLVKDHIEELAKAHVFKKAYLIFNRVYNGK